MGARCPAGGSANPSGSNLGSASFPTTLQQVDRGRWDWTCDQRLTCSKSVCFALRKAQLEPPGLPALIRLIRLDSEGYAWLLPPQGHHQTPETQLKLLLGDYITTYELTYCSPSPSLEMKAKMDTCMWVIYECGKDLTLREHVVKISLVCTLETLNLSLTQVRLMGCKKSYVTPTLSPSRCKDKI